ncbi:uncharacterized protein LOC126617097 [Malus sylvestris]|uniref:uncharacterized protein LOC126617097 n=1 Tax=Malus sylvestris TaxID=3752 RepID=UPI0021AC69F5|nr:uncharacterized protein LOC126617097 [Malus sylvestris]
MASSSGSNNAGPMAADLVLDTAISDWVLIPLSMVMVLIGVLRYFVFKLMRSNQVPDAKIVKEGQLIIRVRNLRVAANFIPPRSSRARRLYYNNEENGLLIVPKGQRAENRPLNVHLTAPFTIATSRLEMVENVAVRVELSNGCMGWGETLILPFMTAEDQHTTMVKAKEACEFL